MLRTERKKIDLIYTDVRKLIIISLFLCMHGMKTVFGRLVDDYLNNLYA